jgi:DNA-binding NarL/FixJ family response regulator
MTVKVLIVDDSRLARMSVIRALNRLRPDYAYIEASHPDDAVEIMRAQGAGVAVVDFNMPGRDGLALAGELKAIDDGIAIAVLSANAQQEIMDGASALGATFLTKPLAEAAFDTFLTAAAAKAGG